MAGLWGTTGLWGERKAGVHTDGVKGEVDGTRAKVARTRKRTRSMTLEPGVRRGPKRRRVSRGWHGAGGGRGQQYSRPSSAMTTRSTRASSKNGLAAAPRLVSCSRATISYSDPSERRKHFLEAQSFARAVRAYYVLAQLGLTQPFHKPRSTPRHRFIKPFHLLFYASSNGGGGGGGGTAPTPSSKDGGGGGAIGVH